MAHVSNLSRYVVLRELENPEALADAVGANVLTRFRKLSKGTT